jgi:hypothetical protein
VPPRKIKTYPPEAENLKTTDFGEFIQAVQNSKSQTKGGCMIKSFERAEL